MLARRGCPSASFYSPGGSFSTEIPRKPLLFSISLGEGAGASLLLSERRYIS
jgi:hypothetical protein